MRRASLALNGLFAALCAFLLVLLSKQRHLNADLARTVAAQKHTILDAEAKAKRSADVAHQNAEAREALAAKAEKAGDADAKAKRRTDGTVDITAWMRKDPQYATYRALMNGKNVAREYRHLDDLKLPPEQLANLKKLLMEREQAADDAMAAATEQGLPRNEASKAQREAKLEVDKEIEQAMGTDVAKAVSTMREVSMYGNNVDYMLGNDMSAAGTPLTSAQRDTLAQAILDAQKRMQEVASANHGNVDWEAIQAEQLNQTAPGVLTPDQLTAFKQALADSQMRQQLIKRAHDAAEKEVGKITSWSYSN